MGRRKSTIPGFERMVHSSKIPLLILDQKWHHLFSEESKPKDVEKLEQKLKKQLAGQGKINQEFKELKGLKTRLMKNIVANMDEIGEQGQETRKLQEDRRLITEINERLEDKEAELRELQVQMEENNALLMVATMEFCYRIMNSNETEREQLASWIDEMRMELKEKIVRKDIIEEKNREIYAYLHDIFGAQVVEAFDLKYAEEYKETQE